MKGICPVCSQPVDVIEGCFNTADIHHLTKWDGRKLCPGSGGLFDDPDDFASTGIRQSIKGQSRLRGHMFQHIMVAFDESPQANRAFQVAMELAKQLKSRLLLLTVCESLPLYTAMIDTQVPNGRQTLLDDLNAYYRKLQDGAMEQATRSSLEVQGLVMVGDEVHTIVDQVVQYNPDLLILGRRHHSAFFGFWSGTVHSIAERVRCDILSVYS
jgi:nucleotide-binding universal stress UspA family protein